MQRLAEIIDRDFNGELDLVVDDASHFYEPTKASFATAFPKLRAGGLYMIEDWSWTFQDAFQDPKSPWFKINSLPNLVVDLMESMAVTGLIDSVEIYPQLLKVWRSSNKVDRPVFGKPARRGRQVTLI